MPSTPKPYKHKEIPNININDPYLLKNQKSMERLKKIYDQEIDYTEDDYHILILCFERLYKGIYKELRNIGAVNIIVSDEEVAGIGQSHPHHFARYANIVNNVIPLADNQEVYNSIYSTIYEELQPAYTPARFSKDYNFESFQRNYRRLETQTYRLYNGLAKQKELHKNNVQEIEKNIDDWS